MKKYEKPKVSIIVPIYNSEKTIEKCLNSIIRQTYDNIELILVNDGSTDNSLAICELYAQKDERIKIISQDNEGLIAARKIGIENATAEIVGFVDSDDWIENNMYEEMINIFQKTGCDLISSGIYRDYLNENRTVEVVDNYEEGYYAEIIKEIYPTMLWNDEKKDFGLYCTLVNKLFKRDVLMPIYRTINTDIFYGEDCITLFSYIMKIRTIYILKKSFYHYNITNGSMCRTANEKLLNNTYALYKGLEKVFVNQGEQSFALLRQLRRYILDVESHTLRMLYDINIAALGNWQFNYNEANGKKVVIYGASGCGQALFRYLNQGDFDVNIIAWVDKNPQGKELQCLHEIKSSSELPQLEYDYIILGVQQESLALSIKQELKNLYNISEELILWKQAEYKSIFDNV